MSQSKLLLRRSAQEAGLDNDREMMSIQEIVRPSLYPDIMWQSSGNQKDAVHPTSSNPFVKMEEESETPNQTQEIVIAKRPASVVSMIQKQRQLFEALNKSSHFVQQNPMTDVARYGQQTVRTAPDQNVLLSMSGHQGITPINNDEHESEAEAPPVITSGSLNHQKVYSKLATDERYFPAELLSTRKQLESAREARNPQRKTLTDLLEEEEKTQDTDDPLQEEDEEGGGEELEDLEEEEVEDYTTNYYDSEGDASDGDGDGEATF